MKPDKRPHAGRPPLPREQRRDRRVYCNLTATELAAFDAKAAAADQSRMGFLRKLILRVIR